MTLDEAVRTLADRDFEAGTHPVTWDGRNDAGVPVGVGVYFAKLDSGGRSTMRRIVRIQ